MANLRHAIPGRTNPMLLLAWPLLIAPQDGRATLEAMLLRYERLRDVEITISRSARDRAGQALLATTSGVLAFSRTDRFRYEFSEYWGGGASIVRNGATLLYVPADGTTATLRKPGASVTSSHSSLTPGAPGFAMTLLFLEGRAAMLRLLPPGAQVTQRGNVLEFVSRDMGHVTIYLRDGLAGEVTYDNQPLRWAAYQFLPVFNERPESPLEWESVTFRKVGRFARGTFSVVPPKGVDVVDERKPH